MLIQRFGVCVLLMLVAVWLPTSLARAQSAKAPSVCRGLDKTDCDEQAECFWVGQAVDRETGAVKRKAYCRTRVGPRTNASSVVICIRPVFEQELELRKQIDGSQEKAERIAKAIVYLRNEFCRSISDTPESASSSQIAENCFQYSGTYRGEKVYWGQCHE